MPLRPGSFGIGTFDVGAWPRWLVMGWLFAVSLLAGTVVFKLLRHLAQVRRIAMTSTPNLDGELLTRYHLAAERVGAWTVPMLRKSVTALGPVIVGFRKQAVVMPEPLIAKLEDGDVELVIAHELHHYRVKDSAWACLPFSVLFLIPWNPLVWWAVRHHMVLTEQSCDEAVVSKKAEVRERYARLLLRIASKDGLPDPRGLVAYGTAASKREIETRIRALFAASAPSVGRFSNIVATVLSLSLLVPVKLVLTAPPRLGTDAPVRAYELTYSVRVLPVPVGFTSGYAAGFGPPGEVVVNFEKPRTIRRAARIDTSGNYQWLEGDSETPDSCGFFVSKAGTVCGMATYSYFGGAHGAAWLPGRTEVQKVPHPIGQGGWCRGTNDLGTFVGTSDVQRAWIKRPGQNPTNLKLPVYCDYSSEAHGVNSKGEAIAIGSPQGMFQFPQAERRSFLISPDETCHDIGFLARSDQTLAFGVNDSSSAVGSSGTINGRKPFCWTKATGILELPLPRAYPEGVARRINSAGWILGIAFDRRTGQSTTVLWTPDMAVHDLDQLIGPHSGVVGGLPVDPDWTDVRFGLGEDGSVAACITTAGRTVPAVLTLLASK
ncbi:MAG: M56 family metallopeptidase [Armatimonadetes bacterium]|nr:M56 family metallopeptidase [Armatimonadota bacterium]